MDAVEFRRIKSCDAILLPNDNNKREKIDRSQFFEAVPCAVLLFDFMDYSTERAYVMLLKGNG